ncbi:MAG TPA: ABC transporter substrate-binding protein [Kineosporiaceae bacterium]|jgi:iron complex transport system substrate-binding protein|nr:ABC transporter substrate-binding protein [Kineosporiaceae bacterium]
MQRTTRRRLVLAAAAPALALLAACGGGTNSATSTTAAPAASASAPAVTYPVTVKADNGSVSIPAQPKKIVSLSPADTEILYAIGAGPQVVAVDDQSNYPQGVPTTKLSGYKPNAEAIAAYGPDLVVLSNDDNGVVAALTKLQVPVLVLGAPKTLDASYAEYTALGTATGHTTEATQTVQKVKDRIAAAVASVPKADKPLKVYHELDQTFFSATSSTFIGSLYQQFGLQNIADAAKGASSGYPQLSAEYVVKSAPDLVVLADTKCCKQDEAALAKRPAFDSLPAVKGNKVLAADDDIASRWGPRIADFAELVAKELGGR